MLMLQYENLLRDASDLQCQEMQTILNTLKLVQFRPSFVSSSTISILAASRPGRCCSTVWWLHEQGKRVMDTNSTLDHRQRLVYLDRGCPLSTHNVITHQLNIDDPAPSMQSKMSGLSAGIFAKTEAC